MTLLLVGIVSAAHATQLTVKGNLDVYGLWSANLFDFDSDKGDADNYFTSQRMRTYFTFAANENLKAVLGLEMDQIWGQDSGGDWGTDGKSNIKIKHAYTDFNFPDTTVNVKAGLQYVALPSVFGHPVFDDDAAALVVSAPVSEMFGVTVGYSRGADKYANIDDGIGDDYDSSDDMDMAFIATPLTFDGAGLTPYFGYVWLGGDYDFTDQQGLDSKLDLSLAEGDDISIWFLGANAKLNMFDPLVLAADVIYGALDSDDFESAGWYAALSASYKLDMMVATLFGTYATGLDDEEDDQTVLPTLAEDWKVTPNLGGLRAFSTASDTFFTKAVGVGSDGTGLWTVGLILDKITFVDNLSHKLILAYAEGTGDEGTSYFTEEDSGWELYLVNQYTIYENLAAINELGYFKGSSEKYDDEEGEDFDASYFATIGFAYKF
jgi:hypothetical protein